MTTERHSEGYEPRWDFEPTPDEFTRARNVGDRGERFVAEWIAGGIEVKTDDAALSTGNVFIEYQCFKNGEWVPSGPFAGNTSYALVIGSWMVATTSERMRTLVEWGIANGRVKEGNATCTYPTRGVVLQIPELAARLRLLDNETALRKKDIA